MNTKVAFLPVPETLREHLDLDFPINPDIPIPVLVSDSQQQLQINMDTVVAGMIRVIEEQSVKKEWIDYYSCFVLYLRPDILTKIQELKENGLEDEKFINAHNLIQEGRLEEGLYLTREYIEKHPLVWNGWFLLGNVLELLGRTEDSKAAFAKADELRG